MFNYIDLSTIMHILSVKESILPMVSVDRINVPNRVGSRFMRKKMEERVIEVSGYIEADTLDERREKVDRLARTLFSEGLAWLIIDDERKYKAIFEGDSIMDNVLFDGVFALKFIAPDPIAYGREVKLKLNNNSTYYNAGTYETYGVLYLAATGGTMTIQPQDAKAYERITIHNLREGDGVVINLAKQQVDVNGSSHMRYIDATSEFFSIKPGRFKLIMTGVKFGDLIFTERWL